MTRRDGWNGRGGESGRRRWRGEGLRWYFVQRISELRRELQRKRLDLRRLRALRDDLSGEGCGVYCVVRMLRAELIQLHVPASHVGVVIKVLGQSKVLVKIHRGSKYGVDIERNIDIAKITPSTRVALHRCGYKLHLIFPTNYDPLFKLMKVEKVPDSTYGMIRDLHQQIKESRRLSNFQLLFESLGIAQPKGVLLYRPPGTGKTLLARAVAHHNDCTYIRVSGSLVQKYIGQGSRMVRELFMMAREHAPSIIFMDEIDSIGSARKCGSVNRDYDVQCTMLELLNQLNRI